MNRSERERGRCASDVYVSHTALSSSSAYGENYLAGSLGLRHPQQPDCAYHRVHVLPTSANEITTSLVSSSTSNGDKKMSRSKGVESQQVVWRCLTCTRTTLCERSPSHYLTTLAAAAANPVSNEDAFKHTSPCRSDRDKGGDANNGRDSNHRNIHSNGSNKDDGRRDGDDPSSPHGAHTDAAAAGAATEKGLVVFDCVGGVPSEADAADGGASDENGASGFGGEASSLYPHPSEWRLQNAGNGYTASVAYFYDCGIPEWVQSCELGNGDSVSCPQLSPAFATPQPQAQCTKTGSTNSSIDTLVSASRESEVSCVAAREMRLCGHCGGVMCAELTVSMAPPVTHAVETMTEPTKESTEEPPVVFEELPDSDHDDDSNHVNASTGAADSESSRYSWWRWSEGATTLITNRYASDAFFPGSTLEDREARAYSWELIHSMLPAFLVAIVHWTVTQFLWRCLQFWMHPLAPRIYRFERPLAQHEEEKKSRVWAARQETIPSPNDLSAAGGSDDDSDHVVSAEKLGNDIASMFASFM